MSAHNICFGLEILKKTTFNHALLTRGLCWSYTTKDLFSHNMVNYHIVPECLDLSGFTVLPAKSDSDLMFCLQSYQELIIDRSLVY